MIRKRLATMLLGALLATVVQAQRSVPPLTGRVVDQADVLSASTEQALTTLLKVHEDSTSNQVAVLTVRSLEGETVEAYALGVATAWGLGRADRDNGVLLLVAVEDRELRIEVGYGLEGALPDAVAARIIRSEIVPSFRAGNFDAGVLAGVQAIVGALEGTYSPPDDVAGVDGMEGMPWWFGLMFLFIPSIFFVQTVFMPGCMRWFLFFFLIPFYGVGGFAIGGFIGAGIVLGLYLIAFLIGSFHPKAKAIREKVRKAQKTGKTVKVGPFTMGGSSSSGGGWSSGGGSSFSGGGGSFGGGGSSGSW